MTDIVKTLRQGSLNKDDYRWKAADEIEKLREQLETAYMDGYDMAKSEYRQCIQEVEGENDRLRAALLDREVAVASYCERIVRLQKALEGK